MQVIPDFAGPQADSLFVPEANMRAGLRMLKATFKSYAYLDSLDRLRFTLAEYHAGNGHVSDARRMAMDLGRDPNKWEGSLAIMLTKLMQRRYYSKTRHGFYAGAKTVEYVEEILNRYRMYMRLVPRYPEEVDDAPQQFVPDPDNLDLGVASDLIDDPLEPE
jgi:membrane-bound lytic murein transglycosylase F